MRIILILIMTIFSTSVSYSSETKERNAAFIDYLFKSGEEPNVKDATWMTDKNLYVGVIDDGTRRDGFAEYICLAAKDYNLIPNLVRIIDVVKVKRTGKFVELGRAHCSRCCS